MYCFKAKLGFRAGADRGLTQVQVLLFFSISDLMVVTKQNSVAAALLFDLEPQDR